MKLGARKESEFKEEVREVGAKACARQTSGRARNVSSRENSGGGGAEGEGTRQRAAERGAQGRARCAQGARKVFWQRDPHHAKHFDKNK